MRREGDVFIVRPLADQYAEQGLSASGGQKDTRKRKGDRHSPESLARRNVKRSARRKKQRVQQNHDRVAVLDMETDPFDAATGQYVMPFLAVLYSHTFETKIIWHDAPKMREHVNYTRGKGCQRKTFLANERIDRENSLKRRKAERAFARHVANEIRALPGSYTIYAHNGGKFDYMFLMSEIRGRVSFKGRSLMDARIGEHILRDSLHIIPTNLASANRKDAISYDWMRQDQRDAHKQQIIDYCIADCRYLLEIVDDFIDRYGFKLSIGQCAMAELKKSYSVKRFGRVLDARVRAFYLGGRVECLAGAGHFVPTGKVFKLYDVNSMYPAVMAHYEHPVGNGEDYFHWVTDPHITGDTFFLELECLNRGAFLAHHDETNVLTSEVKHGHFFVTIHEYLAAIELGLIDDVRLIRTIDCPLKTNFSQFVLPLYDQRRAITEALNAGVFPKDSDVWHKAKRDSLFLKLTLNNAYGKFAQDPRKFKEVYISDAGAMRRRQDPWGNMPLGIDWGRWREYYDLVPRDDRDKEDELSGCGERLQFMDRLSRKIQRRGWGRYPVLSNEDYWIWERPADNFKGYYNVGTAASITGAARAELMRAIAGSARPIYCDTDSLLCEDLAGVRLHDSELGAWKCEGEFVEAYIAGKKSYAFVAVDAADNKLRHKGGSIKLEQMKQIVENDAQINYTLKAPTITRDGLQRYVHRTAKVTASRKGAVNADHG